LLNGKPHGGMMPAMYFLGNRLLGTSNDLPRWDEKQVNHQNHALFCPTCGEVWGRITDTRVAGWFAVTRNCSKHGDGSFIAPWRILFEELPPEVLHYELQIRLNKYEVENGTSKIEPK